MDANPPPDTSSMERPPIIAGPLTWLRKNLFRSWLDSALTILVGLVGLSLFSSFLQWVTVEAQWAIVTKNFRVLLEGLYPLDQSGRVGLMVIFVTLLASLSWGIWGRMYMSAAIALVAGLILFILVPGAANLTWSSDGFGRYLGQEVYPLLVVLRDPVFILMGCLFAGYIAGRVLKRINGWLARRLATALWLLAIPLTFVLVRGLGADTPLLPFVSTNEWGGLLLTFMLAFVAIVACFPLGIVLAVGRAGGGPTQAALELSRRWWLNPARWRQVLARWWRGLGYYPLIKLFCIVYIEFLRGVPLVTVFFTANLIVPLALGDTSIDASVRAMVALTLFEAAYIAEIVRGGLQSVPPGQAEAAKALGMSPIKVMVYITLPQALRTVIPALVGQFITMFKDTSLVAIVGLLDLMGTANGIAAQPEFTERKREVYVFAAIVYFAFSYSMSYAARKLEKRGSGSVRRM